MAGSEADFHKALLETFRVEAREHLQGIVRGLVELEQSSEGPERASIVEVVFRDAHSLKGASRAVGSADVERVCQAMESVFSAMKRKELDVTLPALDLLHRAADGLELILEGGGKGPAEAKESSAKLARELSGLLARPSAEPKTLPPTASAPPSGSQPPAPAMQPPPSAPEARQAAPEPQASERKLGAETVRVSTAKLEELLLDSEELLSPKLGVAHLAAELREVVDDFARWKRDRSRVQTAARSVQTALEAEDNRGDAAVRSIVRDSAVERLLEFFDWNDNYVRELEAKLRGIARMAERNERSLSMTVDNLQKGAKEALMLPFSTITEFLAKVVRDLAREQNKEVRLSIEGAAIEVDRRILQAVKDPLIHLVRNCVDHGFEAPETRLAAGKPASGTLTIAVIPREGSKVELVVSDDGTGIDASKVRIAATKAGILTADQADALGDAEVLPLVFHSGVSTSPIITDLSGRGLGLAIVREKTELLGGSVSLESHAGTGSTFRLLLPMTIATFRGLLVAAAGHQFVIPTAGIERVVAVAPSDVRTVENRGTILLGERVVALVSLADLLDLPPLPAGSAEVPKFPAVVLGGDERMTAFHVDEILGEQETLVRTLGPQIVRLRNFSGAAVLGTGRVVPVLHVADLLQSAASLNPERRRAPEEKAPVGRKSILVVEDSITSRALLRSILEAAGFKVHTSNDGAEGFHAVRQEQFDLVVSDVDMPRMNGFELTARIRADKRSAELPVILVTALESREDRERGIDVGANAYIVKSSFDQGNLLGVIKRLL